MTDPGPDEGSAASPDALETPIRTRFAEPVAPMSPPGSLGAPPGETTSPPPSDGPADEAPTAVEPVAAQEWAEPPAVVPTAVEPAAVEETAAELPALEPPSVEPPALEPPAVEAPAVEAPAVEPAAVAPIALDAASGMEPAPRGAPEDEVAVPALQPVRRSGALVSVLAGMVTALALLTGFLAYTVVDTRGPAPVESSRKAALDAARSAARLVFSYDYRHLTKDFSDGRARTTGKFQAEYDKTTSRLVQDVAPRYKAVVSADVSEASIVSATEDRVVLLLFVNQTSASTLAAHPKITQSRLEMTMQRVGARWLVSDIKAL